MIPIKIAGLISMILLAGSEIFGYDDVILIHGNTFPDFESIKETPRLKVLFKKPCSELHSSSGNLKELISRLRAQVKPSITVVNYRDRYGGEEEQMPIPEKRDGEETKEDKQLMDAYFRKFGNVLLGCCRLGRFECDNGTTAFYATSVKPEEHKGLGAYNSLHSTLAVLSFLLLLFLVI